MTRRPRLRLTPMQRDVLWLCEEAGSDTRFEIAEAVEGLRRLGLVELCYSEPHPEPRDVREKDCARLKQLLILDLLTMTDEGRWTTRGPGFLPAGEQLELCMTEAGYTALTA